MALTKEDLKDSIGNHLNIPKSKSSAVIETFLETIKETLESGEDVMISGFGKFSVQNKDERRGSNPSTGEDFDAGIEEGCEVQLFTGVEGEDEWKKIKSEYERLIGIDYYHS